MPNNGAGFKIISTIDNTAIFNIKTVDKYVKITGIFDFTSWKIEVTDDKVYINPGNHEVWGNHIKTAENRGITLSNYGFSL